MFQPKVAIDFGHPDVSTQGGHRFRSSRCFNPRWPSISVIQMFQPKAAINAGAVGAPLPRAAAVLQGWRDGSPKHSSRGNTPLNAGQKAWLANPAVTPHGSEPEKSHGSHTQQRQQRTSRRRCASSWMAAGFMGSLISGDQCGSLVACATAERCMRLPARHTP